MKTHLERWRALVRTRREQLERQQAALGGPPEDWWADRAPFFARGIWDPAVKPPPGLAQITDRLERGDTLLDVGAGAGRYSVPLAQTLRHVTLVEPSPAMARLAREQLERTQRGNWSLIESGWIEAEGVASHSAVLLANVLAPHEHLAAWIERALAHAREWLFIVFGSHVDTMEPLRRIAVAMHGEARVPQPALPELLPALHELGVYPEVTIFERRFERRYESATAAAREIAATLLVEPTAEALRRIGSLLGSDLRSLPEGGVALPEIVAPLALLSWRSAGRPGGRWRWQAV